MRLYEVKTTEHNGEQEYWGSHLVAARDVDQARKMTRRYFEKWYEDGDGKHADPNDPDRFEFIGGSIILEIDSVTETTLEDWKDKQVELHTIGKLPKVKSLCKKCEVLLAACEHIRDWLDVGGEQSRQFADEIAYLKKTLREIRRV